MSDRGSWIKQWWEISEKFALLDSSAAPLTLMDDWCLWAFGEGAALRVLRKNRGILGEPDNSPKIRKIVAVRNGTPT